MRAKPRALVKEMDSFGLGMEVAVRLAVESEEAMDALKVSAETLTAAAGDSAPSERAVY